MDLASSRNIRSDAFRWEWSPLCFILAGIFVVLLTHREMHLLREPSLLIKVL